MLYVGKDLSYTRGNDVKCLYVFKMSYLESCRGVFRTQTNIYDGTFCENS